MFIRAILVATIILSSGGLNAKASVQTNENCPKLHPGHIWSDYFMHKYPGGGLKLPMAGLDFDAARARNDRGNLRGIDINSCYTVYFRLPHDPNGPPGWDTHHEPFGAQAMQGMAGNPVLHQITVAGAELQFNDSTGVVYDQKKNRVGQLMCRIGNSPDC